MNFFLYFFRITSIFIICFITIAMLGKRVSLLDKEYDEACLATCKSYFKINNSKLASLILLGVINIKFRKKIF